VCAAARASLCAAAPLSERVTQVSVYASDGYTTLKCRSTPIEYIKRGRPCDGTALFAEEGLRYPGFVEFDEVNGKVLTYSRDKGCVCYPAHSAAGAQLTHSCQAHSVRRYVHVHEGLTGAHGRRATRRVFKVFDLKDYRLLYTILHGGIREIKISPGVMLVIHEQQVDHVLLMILAMYAPHPKFSASRGEGPVEDRWCSGRPACGVAGEEVMSTESGFPGNACSETGETLKEFNHPIHPQKRIDFIEQFNEKLLFKQGACVSSARRALGASFRNAFQAD
jgi:hypothetical protein